jgi:hypothetical protein
MDAHVTPLTGDAVFSFDCSPAVPCFNACCRDLVQALSPYDILRLKNRLGISSRRFLATYTTRHVGPETGLPIVTFRFDNRKDRRCPFVTPEGCSVYADRPASCRLYPIARGCSRSRRDGRISENFALIREPHCQGFNRSAPQRIRRWIQGQGLEDYNRFNDLLLELISLKKRLTSGPLDRERADLFYTALYDIDAFRVLVSQMGAARRRDRPEAGPAVPAGDDTQLLRAAHLWVQDAVFGPPQPAKGDRLPGGTSCSAGPIETQWRA